MPGKLQCIICLESVNGLLWDKHIHLDCGDNYCGGCINAAFGFALACEANFPLRCGCKREILVSHTTHLLTQELPDRYDTIVLEWTSAKRKYCAKRLQYIDSEEFREGDRYSICISCDEATCRECKARKSDHDTGCPPDTDREKLLQLSNTENWKQCESCGNLIEKVLRCDHMT